MPGIIYPFWENWCPLIKSLGWSIGRGVAKQSSPMRNWNKCRGGIVKLFLLLSVLQFSLIQGGSQTLILHTLPCLYGHGLANGGLAYNLLIQNHSQQSQGSVPWHTSARQANVTAGGNGSGWVYSHNNKQTFLGKVSQGPQTQHVRPRKQFSSHSTHCKHCNFSTNNTNKLGKHTRSTH